MRKDAGLTHRDRIGPAPVPERGTLPLGARLRELAVLFVRLGFTAFGGPAAHIALFEDEVVRRRRWLTHEQFLDLLGITNLIPGPNSTEMVIHIGHERAGVAGMVVAGVAFILPASCIVGVCAWLYVRYGALPQAEGILYGVKPVVIAIIAQALVALCRKAARTRLLMALGVLGAVAVFLGLGELETLVLAGTAMAFISAARTGIRQHWAGLTVLVAVAGLTLAAILFGPSWQSAGAKPFSPASLFLFFLKVGSVLYGSGYVLLAFIESDLVDRWQWITQAQLLDAVAIGQVTPGPLFTTATFIGFLLAGVTGAAVATLGIFLPSFLFVGAIGFLLPRMRKSVWAGAFLDGVNAASLALMAVVTLQLGVGTFRDPVSVLLAAASAFLLYRFKVNSTWLILGGAVIGLVLTLR
jgi:chromate transporter